MLKILKDIIAETGYRPDAIRKILSGRAGKSSSKRLRLAIYRITGRLLPLPQIAKGPYSNSPIIRGLAALCSAKNKNIKFSKSFFKIFCDDSYSDSYHDNHDYCDRVVECTAHSVSADRELVL